MEGGIDYQIGAAPYDCSFCVNPDPRNRWSDHSSAAQDPSDPNVVWLGEEFGSADTVSSDDWGTSIAQFTNSWR